MARCPELATGTQDGVIAWGAGGRSGGEEMDRDLDVGIELEASSAGDVGDGAGAGGRCG